MKPKRVHIREGERGMFLVFPGTAMSGRFIEGYSVFQSHYMGKDVLEVGAAYAGSPGNLGRLPLGVLVMNGVFRGYDEDSGSFFFDDAYPAAVIRPGGDGSFATTVLSDFEKRIISWQSVSNRFKPAGVDREAVADSLDPLKGRPLKFV